MYRIVGNLLNFSLICFSAGNEISAQDSMVNFGVPHEETAIMPDFPTLNKPYHQDFKWQNLQR
jgi:hypothetical protein